MSSEWPLQKAGDTGHRVKVLQRLLVHRGAKIGIDGMFGPETEGAVKSFLRYCTSLRGPRPAARGPRRVLPVGRCTRLVPETSTADEPRADPNLLTGCGRRLKVRTIC
jgi:hypothetical protein